MCMGQFGIVSQIIDDFIPSLKSKMNYVFDIFLQSKHDVTNQESTTCLNLEIARGYFCDRS